MRIHMKLLKELFLTFFKIGAFTFGGGYAMIPLIKREVVENKKWIDEDEMFDIIAIAESTPGPLAINSATFLGNKFILGILFPPFSKTILLCCRFQKVSALIQ